MRAKNMIHKPTADEMRAYLQARQYVRGVRGGWAEHYFMGGGMRWTFFPKDGRRRSSDDYSLEMAYQCAIERRFE
jgi:hypothetical protein